jgi:hypothetical protein
MDRMSQSETGSHNILIHPNIDTFRKLYSSYAKNQLKHGSRTLLVLLPYYETTAKARDVLLSEGIVDKAITIEANGINNDHDNSRNKRKKEEGSIIIKDSLKVYSTSSYSYSYSCSCSSSADTHDGIINNNNNNNNNNSNTSIGLTQQLIKKAENSGKDGVTIIADMASFYHHNNRSHTQKLVDYELSLSPPAPQPQYDNKKLRGFCVYHKKDFEKRFTEEQKQKLLQHHGQVFIVEDR